MGVPMKETGVVVACGRQRGVKGACRLGDFLGCVVVFFLMELGYDICQEVEVPSVRRKVYNRAWWEERSCRFRYGHIGYSMLFMGTPTRQVQYQKFMP
jgi:hypothetical protein